MISSNGRWTADVVETKVAKVCQAVYRPDGSSLIKQCNYCFSVPLDRLADYCVKAGKRIRSLACCTRGRGRYRMRRKCVWNLFLPFVVAYGWIGYLKWLGTIPYSMMQIQEMNL